MNKTDITIYSTTTCSFCNALKSWLDSQGVDYTYKVTDTDTDVMAEFMSVNDGMLGVPFTVIKSDNGEETKIVGLDKAKFKTALSLA
ncbi:MAG TPA: glutaredoxin family protein [Candidatus Limnocylindrales bacterium]|nr:glutaredoxin family protein [Candidatus Limnocylindrales bacterium]